MGHARINYFSAQLSFLPFLPRLKGKVQSNPTLMARVATKAFFFSYPLRALSPTASLKFFHF